MKVSLLVCYQIYITLLIFTLQLEMSNKMISILHGLSRYLMLEQINEHFLLTN